MYTVEWASNFNGFSKSDPMDLHQFVIFFNEHIAERYFTYTTKNTELPSFVVETRKNQLPHLLGLQHWNNLPVKQPQKQCEYLANGKWNIPFLEKADQGSYREHKARSLFSFLWKIISIPLFLKGLLITLCMSLTWQSKLYSKL